MKFSIYSTAWLCPSSTPALLMTVLLMVTADTTYARVAVLLFTVYPEVLCYTALRRAQLSNVYLQFQQTVKWNLPPCTDPSSKFKNALGINSNKTQTEKKNNNHTCPKSYDQPPENWTSRLLAEMCHPAVTGSWFITRVHKHLVSTFILQPQSKKKKQQPNKSQYVRLTKNKLRSDANKLQQNVARPKDDFTSFLDKILLRVQLKKFGNYIRKPFLPPCTVHCKGNGTVSFILILLVNWQRK